MYVVCGQRWHASVIACLFPSVRVSAPRKFICGCGNKRMKLLLVIGHLARNEEFRTTTMDGVMQWAEESPKVVSLKRHNKT